MRSVAAGLVVITLLAFAAACGNRTPDPNDPMGPMGPENMRVATPDSGAAGVR